MAGDTLEAVKRAILGDELASVTDGVRPGMLDLRPRRGQWLALPYTSLREVTYDPGARPPLRIEFSSYVVEIQGTSLKGVYLSVVGMRAVTLTETQSLHRIGEEYLDEEPPNIDRIVINKKTRRSSAESES